MAMSPLLSAINSVKYQDLQSEEMTKKLYDSGAMSRLSNEITDKALESGMTPEQFDQVLVDSGYHLPYGRGGSAPIKVDPVSGIDPVTPKFEDYFNVQ